MRRKRDGEKIEAGVRGTFGEEGGELEQNYRRMDLAGLQKVDGMTDHAMERRTRQGVRSCSGAGRPLTGRNGNGRWISKLGTKRLI